MSHKISLVFENNCYYVEFNHTRIIATENYESALAVFNKEIKNNHNTKAESWDNRVHQVNTLGMDEVMIYSEYQAMQLGDMKYFQHSGKTFYIGEGKMTVLTGGFEFFYTLLQLQHKGILKNAEALVALCARATEEGIQYTLTEDSIRMASALFNYGMVSYQFSSERMHRGTSSEKCQFEQFIAYVEKVINEKFKI